MDEPKPPSLSERVSELVEELRRIGRNQLTEPLGSGRTATHLFEVVSEAFELLAGEQATLRATCLYGRVPLDETKAEDSLPPCTCSSLLDEPHGDACALGSEVRRRVALAVDRDRAERRRARRPSRAEPRHGGSLEPLPTRMSAYDGLPWEQRRDLAATRYALYVRGELRHPSPFYEVLKMAGEAEDRLEVKRSTISQLERRVQERRAETEDLRRRLAEREGQLEAVRRSASALPGLLERLERDLQKR